MFLVAGIAAQTPDPSIRDGTPCCGHPDTWSEVAQGIGWGLVYAAIVGGVFAIAAALVVKALRDRWPRHRRLAWIPLAAVVATAIAAAIALAVPG